MATPMLAGDCPRCGQRSMTFDAYAVAQSPEIHGGWEVFVVCRQCRKTSTALLLRTQGSNAPMEMTNRFLDGSTGFIFSNWIFEPPAARDCPPFTPPPIERIFKEGAACLAMSKWDAAGTMFRKSVDAATRQLTPVPIDQDASTPNWKTYKDLRLRLDWLFERKLLDNRLKDLASCIHQDGNDAAHDLEGIGEHEARDLEDFTVDVLEIVFTTPGRIAENRRRRDERRGT